LPAKAQKGLLKLLSILVVNTAFPKANGEKFEVTGMLMMATKAGTPNCTGLKLMALGVCK